MPKIPMDTLVWSPIKATYELYEKLNQQAQPIPPDDSAWFAWLDDTSCFVFAGKNGRYTARKETRQRGECYWYAYQTKGKQLNKKYLGKTASVTLARLESLATMLSAQGGYEIGDQSSLAPSPVAIYTGGNANLPSSSHTIQQEYPSHPLLATKLHMPHLRTELVDRTQLIGKLRQSVKCPLTLISAPAGFGKTTLLVQWLSKVNIPVAWLSLEQEDNDPTRFLSYIIAALQTLDSQIGAVALMLVRTPQPPPPETILAMLANDLVAQGSEDVILVLDDYQVITAEPLQAGMMFLLDHLPPHLHLILATRADPPLSLARLRARGQLLEVRAADLRFAGDETRAFLQGVMGLKLSSETIAALETRTEGWIAGLQLAALSLQGSSDTSSFLTDFTGTNRFIADYLSEEVFIRQPPSVQTFLMRTSILDRLSGSLCDAVTGQEDSQQMLEMLEKANLFVITLDEVRGWYRYHRLFADMLRCLLQQREPTMMTELHRRASSWYEKHNLPAEAIQHALAAPDVELAARLIEPIVLPLAFRGQMNTVLKWEKALPETLLRTRPLLCVYYARLLIYSNQFAAAEVYLRRAEEQIQKEMPTEQTQIIHGWASSVRAFISAFNGDLPQAIPLADRALDLLPETETISRAGATAIAILDYLISGDVTQENEQIFAWRVALIRSLENPFATVSSIVELARFHTLQGRLRQAAATYAQMEQAISRLEFLQTLFSGAYYYFGLGDLLYEWNELETAEHHLLDGVGLMNEEVPLAPWHAIQGYNALACLQQARGKPSAARATLNTLSQIFQQRHVADSMLAQHAAKRARLDLLQGNIAAAIDWAKTSGLSLDKPSITYPREEQYLTLAQVYIAQARSGPKSNFVENVLCLLERLLQEAESKARTGSILKILIVRALALEVQGNQLEALATLERALVLAEPEGYIRLFVDEGTPMQDLLCRVQAHGRLAEYVVTLLNAYEAHPSLHPPPLPEFKNLLAETFTEREREVLRLLVEGDSNQEIAQKLVIATDTVKRHVTHIFSKLGAQNRVQAIRQAQKIGLFASASETLTVVPFPLTDQQQDLEHR